MVPKVGHFLSRNRLKNTGICRFCPRISILFLNFGNVLKSFGTCAIITNPKWSLIGALSFSPYIPLESKLLR